MTFYRLSDAEADLAIGLCPLALKLFLYVRTRCPFKDSIPNFGVDDLIERFKAKRDTILRLLRELKRIELLPLSLHSLILGIRPRAERSPRSPNEPEKDHHDLSVNPKPLPEAASGSTNNRFKDPDQNNGGSPLDDQGVYGQLVASIEGIGIRANTTIQDTIYRLYQEFGPAAAARRVELAIGSFKEQKEKRAIPNPGGFINAALKRCFTPNEDGYKKRKDSPPAAPGAPAPPAAPPAAPPTAPAAAPTAPAAPPPLSPQARTKLEQWCDQHLMKGSRSDVLTRLALALEKGYRADLMELLAMRKDWRIQLVGDRVADAL